MLQQPAKAGPLFGLQAAQQTFLHVSHGQVDGQHPARAQRRKLCRHGAPAGKSGTPDDEPAGLQGSQEFDHALRRDECGARELGVRKLGTIRQRRQQLRLRRRQIQGREGFFGSRAQGALNLPQQPAYRSQAGRFSGA